VRVIEGTRPPEFDREEIVRNFEIPAGVAGSGLTRLTVVVRVTVHEDGSITRVEVLRGHPLIPNENVVRAVERAHASPARMADGSPYAVIHTFPITLALTL
jgi:TonB family protein